MERSKQKIRDLQAELCIVRQEATTYSLENKLLREEKRTRKKREKPVDPETKRRYEMECATWIKKRRKTSAEAVVKVTKKDKRAFQKSTILRQIRGMQQELVSLRDIMDSVVEDAPSHQFTPLECRNDFCDGFMIPLGPNKTPLELHGFFKGFGLDVLMPTVTKKPGFCWVKLTDS